MSIYPVGPEDELEDDGWSAEADDELVRTDEEELDLDELDEFDEEE